MSGHYLVLTGAYNNVGDYLIAARATALIRKHRPDREVVEWARREISSPEIEKVATSARAILVAGGPAFRADLVPTVVPEAILDYARKGVPVLLFGVGWKDALGTWEKANHAPLGRGALDLLRAAKQTGHAHASRDLHTKYIAKRHGFDNVTVTGCPALFREDGVPEAPVPAGTTPHILLSPGVSHLKDARGLAQVTFLARELKARWPNARLTAAFHHSIDRDALIAAYGPKSRHVLAFDKTETLRSVLAQQDIAVADVSGDLAKMRALYDSADGHIGYRVHGHVYMTSAGKSSVLLAEDNRALGFKDLIGGAIFDVVPRPAGQCLRDRIKRTVRKRLGIQPAPTDVTDVPNIALQALSNALDGETTLQALSLAAIRTLEQKMIAYLEALP